MSVCIECHAVETLEADGIGGRVCTACGHTLDDTECLTVEVTAGSGMRVSEGGGYFSLDPHSNVGKIRLAAHSGALIASMPAFYHEPLLVSLAKPPWRVNAVSCLGGLVEQDDALTPCAF